MQYLRSIFGTKMFIFHSKELVKSKKLMFGDLILLAEATKSVSGLMTFEC